MNLLDIIIIALMIFFIGKGIIRGSIREVASLAGLILGVSLAVHFQPRVTDYFRQHLPPTQFLPLISFGAIFISVFISCTFLGLALRKLAQKASLGSLDRVLGAVVGFMKGAVIVFVGIAMTTYFLPSKTSMIAGSKLAQIVIDSPPYRTMKRLMSPDQFEDWKKKIKGGQKENKQIEPEKTDYKARAK